MLVDWELELPSGVKMITIDEAFKKFKSRLELNDREQKDAIKKHTEVREYVASGFSIKDDFLSGSYKRHTKTKPLKDVDIFFVLNEEKESKYLKDPKGLIADMAKHLAKKYGEKNINPNRRSVEIVFNNAPEDSDDDTDVVFSIDVVPGFESGKNYKIPDALLKEGWVLTNPKIHAEKATQANKDFDEEWKPMVKMIKKWNEHHGKPIKPSFLIEVMALQIFKGPFSGGYVYELKSFFSTANDQIGQTWPDPAGLGSPVSDQMTAEKISNAKTKLREAEKFISEAVQLSKQGKNGEALRVWREKIFGPKFPLS